jgi:Polysaccharide lyase 14
MQLNKQTLFHFAFNAIGVLIGLAVVGYVVDSLFITETQAPCSTSYPAPTRFPLQTREGAPVSSIELQARAGLPEWGVIENATVVADPAAPTGAALDIKLAKVPDAGPTTRPANGVDFRWRPAGIAAAKAACLRYSVWLPDDFAFNTGGLLPGLLGSQPAAAADDDQAARFGARPQWRREATGYFAVATAENNYHDISRHSFPIPVGRWIRIEQELVLNTPGEANGMARVWIDGELQAESAGLPWRTDETGKLIGVLVNVGYLNTSANGASSLRLSPFEISWK